MKTNDRNLIIIYIIWLFSFILYPLWHFKQNNLLYDLTVLILFSLYLIINIFIIKKLTILINKKYVFSDKTEPTKISSNSIKIIALIFFGYFIIFIKPMLFLTIPSFGDHGYHSYAPIPVYEYFIDIISKKIHIPLNIIIRLFLWIIIFISFRKRKQISVFFNSLIFTSKKTFIFSGISFFIGLLILFSKVLDKIGANLHYHIFRYPPFGKVFYFISYTLFGINVFSGRLLAMIFIFISAIYLYKTLALFINDEKINIFSIILFLFFPFITFYNHIFMLEAGLIMFSTLITYYFFKFEKTNNLKFYFLFIIFLILGFLYKRPIATIIFPVIIYWIITKRFFKNFLLFFLTIYIFSATLTPYIIITFTKAKKSYGFTDKKSKRDASFYLRFFSSKLNSAGSYTYKMKNKNIRTGTLQSNLTILNSIIILFSIFIFLVINKDKDKRNLIIWLLSFFILHYITISMTKTQNVRNFSFVICLLIIPIALIIEFIKDKFNSKTANLLIIILFLNELLFSPFLNLKKLNLDFKKTDTVLSDFNYLPIDQALKYLKDNQNTFKKKKIYVPFMTEPIQFYLYYYNTKNIFRWIRKPLLSVFNKKIQQYTDDKVIYNFWNNNYYSLLSKYDYLIFSSSPTILDGLLDIDLMHFLYNKIAKDKRFEIIKTFQNENDKITLIKIRKQK